MAQVLEFKLPDLGEGLTEAEIVRWLVEVGDVVAVDQLVVEVETAKAMVEVPCPYGGVVTARFGEEGTELPVGAPLLTVAVGAPASSIEGAADDEGSGNVLVGYGTGRLRRGAEGCGRPLVRLRYGGRRVRPRARTATRPSCPPGPGPGLGAAASRAGAGASAHDRMPRVPCPSSPRSCAGSPGRTEWICGSWRAPGPTV